MPGSKKAGLFCLGKFSSSVATRGLEPRRLAAQDPKSCVSANFTKRPSCGILLSKRGSGDTSPRFVSEILSVHRR